MAYIVLIFHFPWARENLRHVPLPESGGSSSEVATLGWQEGGLRNPMPPLPHSAALFTNPQATFYWAMKSTMMITKHYKYELSIPSSI